MIEASAVMASAMQATDTENTEPLKVTFFPALYLQRRIWVLNVLRREDVVSVLDIGCGEGELLACLAQPAPWLRPPPASISPLRPKATSNESVGEIANLHCLHLHGLDISLPDLHYAVQGSAPHPPVPPADMTLGMNGTVRWEPLEVKIWHGGFSECINPSFFGVECIVSTEVIEHLPPDILPSYAPVLLGIYHPRLFLITTPSYTFNARWTPPGIAEREGYPDPTQRTNRIFRHHDHKFEWTIDEFNNYCEEAAEEWGYEVVVGTVGRALEEDPWGRDEECGGASQVAEFRRKEGKDLDEMRSVKSADFLKEHAGEGEHRLLVTHQHSVHPSSQRPTTDLGIIANAIKQKMVAFRESLIRFEELWFELDISALCGGWIELLLDAVEAEEGLILRKDTEREKDGQVTVSVSERKEDWRVELVGAVDGKAHLWEQQVELETLDEPIHSDEVDEPTEESDEHEDRQEYERRIMSGWDIPAQTSDGWGSGADSSGWGDAVSSWGWQQGDIKDDDTAEASTASWADTKMSWPSPPSNSSWGASTREI